MKPIIQAINSLLFLSFLVFLIPAKLSAQGNNSYQLFYDELSPYGNWVNTIDYGYAWVPNVEVGFSPYATNGYWAYTDEGWTWISNYSWGWAPFHYGRWYFDNFYGPMWIPGYEWGPAWVIWRYSQGYYGWAPIGPGIGYHEAYGNNYHVSHHHWRFVHNRDMGRTNIPNYYLHTSDNANIIKHSSVVNNVTGTKNYYGGPQRSEVEKYTGKIFSPMTIEESNNHAATIQNNHLQIYRPQIQKNNSEGLAPAPAHVKELKEINRQQVVPVKSHERPASNPKQDNQTSPDHPVQQHNDLPERNPATFPRQTNPMQHNNEQNDLQRDSRPDHPQQNQVAPPSRPQQQQQNQSRPEPIQHIEPQAPRPLTPPRQPMKLNNRQSNGIRKHVTHNRS